MSYIGYLWLYLAILLIAGYLLLYIVITGYIYRVSSIRVQLEAAEGILLLFETFSFFLFFILHERVQEELALLKISDQLLFEKKWLRNFGHFPRF